MTNRRRPFLLMLVAALLACGTPYAVRHVVQPGDTLPRLAGRYGVEEAELREFNRLQAEDRLRPGDVVFIPGDRRPRPVPRETAGPAPAPAPQVTAVPVGRPAPAPGGGEAGESRRRSTWSWPVSGEILVAYGTGPAGESRGVDIAAAPGSEVRATAAGAATYAGTPAPAYGPIVILEHGEGLFSVYSNLSDISVRKGQRLSRGEVLGRSGQAGNGKPAHLHFEVRRDEKPMDPLLFLPPR